MMRRVELERVIQINNFAWLTRFYSISANIRSLICLSSLRLISHWNVGRVIQEMVTHKKRTPKLAHTVNPRTAPRVHKFDNMGTSRGKRLTRILCPKHNTARGPRDIIERCCVAIVVDARKDINGKDADRNVNCIAQSSVRIERGEHNRSIPIIQSIIKKGINRAVKIVISDSNASPLVQITSVHWL